MHCLPFVPKDPDLGLYSQKSGDSSKYTRSFLVGFFIFLLILFNLFFFLLSCTKLAPSNFSFKYAPMERNSFIFCQQILIEQEPDTPWHLHTRSIFIFTAWNRKVFEKSEKELKKKYSRDRICFVVRNITNYDIYKMKYDWHNEFETTYMKSFSCYSKKYIYFCICTWCGNAWMFGYQRNGSRRCFAILDINISYHFSIHLMLDFASRKKS